MIADDTILLTGLHSDEYPARVAFEDFDDDGKPVSAVLQMQDEDGEWHTLRRLQDDQMAMYWADYQHWADDAAADALVLFRSAA